MENTNWSVGRVAQRCGVKVSTLHYYESKGLIFSTRNAGNQRRYRPEVLRRVSVIKAAQKMGISLESIKIALANLPENRTPTKRDWERLSKQWRAELDGRIAYLESLRDSLTGCIGCGCLSMTNCPIYNEADHLGVGRAGPVILDRSAPD